MNIPAAAAAVTSAVGWQKSAEGIVGRKAEGLNGSPKGDLKERSNRLSRSEGTESVGQQQLPLWDITDTGTIGEDATVTGSRLMERVLEKENMIKAHIRVKQNGGSAGVDGMSVLAADRPHHETLTGKVRQTLPEGTYQPQPVKRVMIPRHGDGERPLGIPTVQDRLIQQALMQVSQQDWDGTFSEYSYGFRPNKTAHQAVATAQKLLLEETALRS